MGSDPYGGFEGYCEAHGIYFYKVVTEKGDLPFVTKDEADACLRGLALFDIDAKIEKIE